MCVGPMDSLGAVARDERRHAPILNRIILNRVQPEGVLSLFDRVVRYQVLEDRAIGLRLEDCHVGNSERLGAA